MRSSTILFFVAAAMGASAVATSPPAAINNIVVAESADQPTAAGQDELELVHIQSSRSTSQRFRTQPMAYAQERELAYPASAIVHEPDSFEQEAQNIPAEVIATEQARRDTHSLSIEETSSTPADDDDDLGPLDSELPAHLQSRAKADLQTLPADGKLRTVLPRSAIAAGKIGNLAPGVSVAQLKLFKDHFHPAGHINFKQGEAALAARGRFPDDIFNSKPAKQLQKALDATLKVSTNKQLKVQGAKKLPQPLGGPHILVEVNQNKKTGLPQVHVAPGFGNLANGDVHLHPPYKGRRNAVEVEKASDYKGARPAKLRLAA